MPDWKSILIPHTPVLELVVRASLLYLGLLVITRVIGLRRTSAGLGVTDLLVVVLAADAVSQGLSLNSASVADGLILVTMILVWSVALDALGYLSPRLNAIIEGRSRQLISNGEVRARALRSELITDEELRTQMRLHGIEDLSEIRRAYIEPNGLISVIRKDGDEPYEPNDHPAVG